MKTKLVLFSICIALLSMGATAKIKDGKAMTGNSLTEFGKYTIAISQAPMVYEDQVLETFELTYENTNAPVRIGVLCEDEKKCKTYIVRTAEFEIEYACQNNVFGVKKMEPRFQQLPKEEMELKLDKVAYYAQRVICQNKKSQDDLLGLIACYFPDLVKEEYQASF
ncbi:hypothetical protein [Draconibacterium halophilum]|uniref:Uncharacterized protein n=1 Tax=Draconibacterium halophilum TaxID=2706887 RepID=A0A6C0RDA1_9BACT|nr:hypothetical protein [Draconibacterium halophilum]QIA08628.1 hypothetical protein G0Q07_13280 [Draconibacterium halophilum]